MAQSRMLRHFIRRFSQVAETEESPKHSRLKRLGQYFKFIADDYKYAAKDTLQDMKDRPIKSAFYISLLSAVGYLFKKNPSEEDFKEQLVLNSNQLMQISDAIRNPYSERHMRKLWENYNTGTMRRFTIGVASIMWVDNNDRGVDVYQNRCKPLKVGWLDLKDRVVDIGVLGKWWWLEDAMRDWDINPTEWGEKEERDIAPGMKISE